MVSTRKTREDAACADGNQPEREEKPGEAGQSLQTHTSSAMPLGPINGRSWEDPGGDTVLRQHLLHIFSRPCAESPGVLVNLDRSESKPSRIAGNYHMHHCAFLFIIGFIKMGDPPALPGRIPFV